MWPPLYAGCSRVALREGGFVSGRVDRPPRLRRPVWSLFWRRHLAHGWPGGSPRLSGDTVVVFGGISCWPTCCDSPFPPLSARV